MSLRSVIALSLALASASLSAADFDADKFLAEKCSSCHDSSVYTRPNHRVQSLQGLEQQVRRCDSMIGTKLFEDDIKTLVDHLNQKYYHF
jgi:cytochrome c553